MYSDSFYPPPLSPSLFLPPTTQLQAHSQKGLAEESTCQSYSNESICQSNMCGSGKHCYWNYTTEICGCCSKECSYPLELNKLLCDCFCSASLTCSGNRYMNYRTCECECLHQECTDGQVLNSKTCQCMCPEYSYWDSSAMHCIADCEKMSAQYCVQVKSEKNTHASCIRDGDTCRRPSCTTFYRDKNVCSISKCEETGKMCRLVCYPRQQLTSLCTENVYHLPVCVCVYVCVCVCIPM